MDTTILAILEFNIPVYHLFASLDINKALLTTKKKNSQINDIWAFSMGFECLVDCVCVCVCLERELGCLSQDWAVNCLFSVTSKVVRKQINNSI